LCAGRMAVGSIGSLCSAMFRGFEKFGWHARTVVLGNVLEASVLVPTLLLGGRLRAALIAQLAAAFVTAGIQVALLLRLGIGRLQFKPRALLGLLHGGLGFLVLDLVLRLQPYIDASFLSRLARPEAMGWYSAASRIVGILLFPATTLSIAIYPTIARLWAEDQPSYASLVRLALRAGVSASVTIAELAMVAAGFVIIPAGVIDRSLVGTVARALAAAVGMASVGFALRSIPFLALPLSVGTYVAILWALGGLDREILDL